MAADTGHRALAEELRRRARAGADPAATSAALRIGADEQADAREPYADLARTIGEASYRVTDAQVAAVRDAAGSDLGAFEVVLAAGVGAGLRRWDAAIRAIEEARDAAG
ncbi:hypothetical protein [Microbacterium capsulatum]|uniref:Uncharacterized protein n=1 Tax=Microbacterium capsulatum TaxID=3041921 RepID=A0ABU0XI93_9MICO|nr:hypothetical protein [Microbacterium sp. ASV81]MDQ4214856.1 hypothetical protein [Microbacterium sp. ASV81]